MITLYHHPICPLSRQIRIYLKELNYKFHAIKEDYWRSSPTYLQINPDGCVPSLLLTEKQVIVGVYAITEYLGDRADNFFFMPRDILERAEIRRRVFWFNDRFYRQVSKIIIHEKMIRLMSNAAPRSNFLSAATKNLQHHLQYLTNLLQNQNYIVADTISCADIAASSHISIMDYFGEINWDHWPKIKDWYSIVKSRPGFQSILEDKIPGFIPPIHYKLLDF